MLQTKTINSNVVAVSWDPASILVRSHGKDQFGHEQELLNISPGGVITVNKRIADKFGLRIEIVGE